MSASEAEARFALRSRRIVTPDGEVDGWVVVAGERIEAVLPRGETPTPDVPVTDLGDRVLLPGFVDTHVHVNEPGRTGWEGFASATRAAAAAGITTLVDMPLNSSPVTVDSAALDAKLAAAHGKLMVDVAFWGGVVPSSTPEDLEALLDRGVCGVKVFLVDSGIDEFPPVGEAELLPAMERLAHRGFPLLAHAEIPDPADSAPDPAVDPRSYGAYLASRPESWEERAIELLIDLCRRTGCPVHIVHLATASALPLLESARREGLPVTVETCPHYLVFAAEELPDGDPRFKCAPPIRQARHRDALWGALRSGALDLIASDHSPAPGELKGLAGPGGVDTEVDTVVDGDLFAAWGGIASLQLGPSAVWTEGRRRGATVVDLARWMATAPARLAGLDRKGRIAPGCDADLVAWDPEAQWTVDGARLEHRHPATPYHGRVLEGVVVTTWLRGRRVFEIRRPGDGGAASPGRGEGVFVGPTRGRTLRRG